MGSGSCLVPGKGADHDHGHFYCLALFRLGSRKWEAESHLGGATRDEGEGGTFPFLGLHRRLRFEERPPLMPPCPLLRGHSRSGGLLIPRRSQAFMHKHRELLSHGRGAGQGGNGVARTARAPPGQSAPQVCTTPATTVPASYSCPGASGEQMPIRADTLTRTGWTAMVICYSEWFLSAKDSEPPKCPSRWSG